MEENNELFTGEITVDAISYAMLTGTHSLIAGATGSGKSTVLDTFLFNLCHYPPENMVYAIIDLKRISLTPWKKTPHCLAYASTPETARQLIKLFVANLERRFQEMEKTGSRQYTGTKLYLIIDESADLLATVPGCLPDLTKILRLGRAGSVGLIMASQSPAKRNIPARLQENFDVLIGLRCRDVIASRQIIGATGCEKLPRFGRAIIYTPALLKAQEVKAVKIPDEELMNYLERLATVPNRIYFEVCPPNAPKRPGRHRPRFRLPIYRPLIIRFLKWLYE